MLSKTDGLLFLVSRWLAESKEGIVTQDANGITMRNVTIHCDKDHLASNSNRNMPWIISFDEGQVFIKESGGPLLRYPAYQCRHPQEKGSGELGEGVPAKNCLNE